MRAKKIKSYQIPRKVFSYKNRWVALTPDGRKVLVTGKRLDGVLEKAKKLGCQEPALIWAPKEWGLYVLLNEISIPKTSR